MVQIVPSLFAARSLGLIARTTAAGDKKGPLIALITKHGNWPKRRRPMVQVQRKAGASIENWRKHTRKWQAAAAGPGTLGDRVAGGPQVREPFLQAALQ